MISDFNKYFMDLCNFSLTALWLNNTKATTKMDGFVVALGESKIMVCTGPIKASKVSNVTPHKHTHT